MAKKPQPQVIMYGLRIKGQDRLLEWSSSSNPEGGECVDVRFYLTERGESVWLASDYVKAVKAAHTSTEWYNANYDTPENTFAGNVEVIMVEMTLGRA